MGRPPVRGDNPRDNPRALASGLSYAQVDNHGITIYTTYISVDLAHHEILRAKVGEDGIKYAIVILGIILSNVLSQNANLGEYICTVTHCINIFANFDRLTNLSRIDFPILIICTSSFPTA